MVAPSRLRWLPRQLEFPATKVRRCPGGSAREPRTIPRPIPSISHPTSSADTQPLIGGKAVDAALDIEQHVDAPDCLQCNRRDRACVLAASRIGGDIGQFKELPPGVRPAKRRRDWPRRAGRLVELIVPVIGVGLQNAREVSKMPDRMFMPPVPRGQTQL